MNRPHDGMMIAKLAIILCNHNGWIDTNINGDEFRKRIEDILGETILQHPNDLNLAMINHVSKCISCSLPPDE